MVVDFFLDWFWVGDFYLLDHHLILRLQLFLLYPHFLLLQFELIFYHLPNFGFLISCEQIVLSVVWLVSVGDVLIVEVNEVHVVVSFRHLVDEEKVI